MVKRKVTHEVAKKAPYEVWNAFVDLLAMEDYGDLDEVQRAAHLAFWYDSEVQNGGHMQYFENRGIELLRETLKALDGVGGECQRRVLDSATQRYESSQRAHIETIEQYVSAALEGEFDPFDAAYYACEPSIQDLLEEYLERHRDSFIEIVE
jgi:hypothetical protein